MRVSKPVADRSRYLGTERCSSTSLVLRYYAADGCDTLGLIAWTKWGRFCSETRPGYGNPRHLMTGCGTCSSRHAQFACFSPPPWTAQFRQAATPRSQSSSWAWPGRSSAHFPPFPFDLAHRSPCRSLIHRPNQPLRFIPLLNRWSLTRFSARPSHAPFATTTFHPTESPALSPTFIWNRQRKINTILRNPRSVRQPPNHCP